MIHLQNTIFHLFVLFIFESTALFSDSDACPRRDVVSAILMLICRPKPVSVLQAGAYKSTGMQFRINRNSSPHPSIRFISQSTAFRLLFNLLVCFCSNFLLSFRLIQTSYSGPFSGSAVAFQHPARSSPSAEAVQVSFKRFCRTPSATPYFSGQFSP